ncbi:M20 metallopeptidase family protein [Macrococcus lamae]|uniref:Amidohydrolase n=1 Tax=Macrococcus lamae TaxID=198484 RepID=A0A4R6BTL8_9STAP|nr:amidohydrolase [Macrococcus lamae]TDM10410.1 amidohydrolase [Macrococcus lamae]
MSYQNYEERIIQYRRHLHAHPELSFQEYETAKYIREILETMENCEVIHLTETGTVGVFNKGQGKKVGLRADIDALPIEEERTEFDFVSQNKGVMHACGHDGHTAILLGAAHYINEHIDEFPNEIHCIFQHAEELIPGGAREMVATGHFDDFDFIYGHHLMALLEEGLIDIKEGAASANSDVYQIIIQGRGGHASQPHVNIDPVLIGSQYITNLQQIVSRQIDPFMPAVISNTVFQGGQLASANVIPDKVTLGGSVRTTTVETRELIKRNMEKQLKNLCEGVGANYTFNYTDGYDAVINDPDKTEFVRSIAENLYPGKVVRELPMMGGEDFSAFSNKVPSFYAFIGTGRKEGEYDVAHHHPRFALNEDAFEIGYNLFIEVAKEYR